MSANKESFPKSLKIKVEQGSYVQYHIQILSLPVSEEGELSYEIEFLGCSKEYKPKVLNYKTPKLMSFLDIADAISREILPFEVDIKNEKKGKK